MSQAIHILAAQTFKALEALLVDERVRALQRILGPDVELYLVGGTVRDAILGKPNTDLDFATKLPPHEITRCLEKAGIHVIPTGLKHQTVTALPIEGEKSIEITSFRGPGMSPEEGLVLGQSIEEDVSYRDFTINALVLNIDGAHLLDYVGGLHDLETKIIRAVGSPQERFQEDPLRTLRMVRFGCLDKFFIDDSTKEAAREFRADLLQISIERIRDEFSKILLSEHPDCGFQLLLELGFLGHIAPEIQHFVGFEQNQFHKADLFRHTLEVLRKTSPNLALRLAALLHDIGKPETLSIDPRTGERHFFRHESIGVALAQEFCKRLKYSNEIIDQVSTLVTTHMRPLDAGPGGLRRLLRDTGNVFPLWRELKEADASACKMDTGDLAQRLANFDQAIEDVKRGPELGRLSNLAINGNDLLAMGLQEGPMIGKVLRALHERVLDNPQLNEKSPLLGLVPQIIEDLN